MKYKCADGVDRDKVIDEYIAFEKEVDELRKKLTDLNNEFEAKLRRLQYISFNHLGGFGSIMVAKVKADEMKNEQSVIKCSNCGEIIKSSGEHFNEVTLPTDAGGWNCTQKR